MNELMLFFVLYSTLERGNHFFTIQSIKQNKIRRINILLCFESEKASQITASATFRTFMKEQFVDITHLCLARVPCLNQALKFVPAVVFN